VKSGVHDRIESIFVPLNTRCRWPDGGSFAVYDTISYRALSFHLSPSSPQAHC